MDINVSNIKGYVDNPYSLLNMCRVNNTSLCSLATVIAYLSIYYLPFIIFLGISTNILIIYIFWIGTKKKSRQIIYLGAMALADIGNILVMGVFWFIPTKGIPFITNGRYYFITINHSNFLCVFHRFLISFFSCLTSNYFVLISIDRVLAIYFPMKFKLIPIKYSWILVAIVAVLSFLLMIPIIFGLKWQVTKDYYLLCALKGELYWRIYNILFGNCGLVAAIIVVILNLALVIRLLQIKRFRRDLQEHHPNMEIFQKQEIPACILLILISFIFISLSLPMVVSNLLEFYPQYVKGDTEAARYFYSIYDISWILFVTQCSANWIIYMCRMKSFREKNLKIFKCKIFFSKFKNELKTLRRCDNII